MKVSKARIEECIAVVARFKQRAAEFAASIESFDESARMPEGADEDGVIGDCACDMRGVADQFQDLLNELKRIPSENLR